MSAAIAQVEPLTTARALRGPFDYLLPEELRQGVGIGSMLVVPFGRREVLGVVVGLADRSEISKEKLLAPLRALELGVPVDLVALAEWVAAEYCSTVARALRLVLPPGPVRPPSVRARRKLIRRPVHLPVGARRAEPPVLTEDQHAVLDELVVGLARRECSECLLHGVTGSGKTEVYLRAASAALEQGRGAIVLVPEIALTPQIVSRFIERFGDTVAVLHSRLRLPERREEWRRLRAGEARVCVGPRSAVFAPIEQLGMIVVDEEHDSSYKHEGDPRYDARAVARRRAELSGALLLLGSATPRAESAHRTPRLRLPARVDRRPLPEVEILDMREQTPGLHPRSAEALVHVRREGGKAIVLLNRRGWSSFLSCRSCGLVWSCPECDVALVLHRAERCVACHHCGHRDAIPQRCRCGSTSLARHGAGTERLEHELSAALDEGSFPIFRLDADAVGVDESQTRREHEQGEGGAGALLRRFEAASSGVLIGTQMVAKGHDFPDVSLGVVLDADATLRFPDFRAEERTFALIAQLAGRVGRGTHGRVLVQTIAPQARAILCAAKHDSDRFLAGELERRAELRYPPFSQLIRVICSSVQERPAVVAASALAGELRGCLQGEEASVLGPAALFRLRGRERRSLVIKASEQAHAVHAVGEAVQRVVSTRAHHEVSFSVDVDPQ